MIENAYARSQGDYQVGEEILESVISISGNPKTQFVGAYGSEPRIQLNDKLAHGRRYQLNLFTAEQETRKEEDTKQDYQ